MRVTAATFAPAYNSIVVNSTSPRSAAKCSAVMPSPRPAFASAPCFSSVRTAARWSGFPVHPRLRLVEEVRGLADSELANLVELENPLFAVAVVRRGMERLLRLALREDAVLRVAARLERHDTGHVGLQREHLDVEHQPHVLGERVGDAGRRLGQLARLAARVARFDRLNAAL